MRYLLISILVGIIAGLQYVNAELHKDEPVKYWIAMGVALLACIVEMIAIWKWILTIV